MSTDNVWTHKGTFLLAAVGSAVGLGNLWRFPYLVGEHGGGAFILVYAVCVLAIGVPILIAEVLLGRSSRRSPIMGMQFLTRCHGASRGWEVIGWLSAFSAILVLSFYSVISGWALHYLWEMLTGKLREATSISMQQDFAALLDSPLLLTLYHTLFIVGCAIIVARGIHRGLERTLRVLMPLLLLILMLVVFYAGSVGDMSAAADFLLSFDVERLSLEGWLEAMGQSFFTLSLGMGAIMAYGAYMSSDASLTLTAFSIALIDTLVAILAGLAIFALVFGAGLAPDSGPGLMFISLPLAFSAMPYGALLGSLFFLLVLGAAASSAVSLIEPVAAWLVERFALARAVATGVVVIIAWSLGLATVVSFNLWQADSPFHQWFGLSAFNVFELISHVTLPLCGLLIALFAGWALTPTESHKEMHTRSQWLHLWWLLIRFVAPTGVAFVFLRALPWIEGYLLPTLGAVIIVGAFAASRVLVSHPGADST
ncbi:transporter [Halomonas cupida]|uniref:Transporter n=1 Tax=Halomonas cupida TaxID=44933 RepID=A0A1M7FX65_9GAMM|nr:sodium-dependent transporter [Halomonas cupida]GEN23556.1 transporter [Halomonas cupida]SHM08239.1 neurotransmitter:Na+ symporter, NSS family [Halomonas cupida]